MQSFPLRMQNSVRNRDAVLRNVGILLQMHVYRKLFELYCKRRLDYKDEIGHRHEPVLTPTCMQML